MKFHVRSESTHVGRPHAGTRSLLPCLSLCLAMALVVTGCASTPHHKQVRGDAQERFNLVQAQMSYDQARQAYETGQLDKAQRMVDVAIARAPEMSDYHLLKGRILLEQNRLEPALRSFDDALEHNAENHTAHYFRGIVLQRWSKFEEAFEAYDTAYAHQFQSVHYLLAAAEMLITLGRYTEAEQMVLPRMTYFENNAAMHQLLGQISLLQRDYSRAAERFEEARLLNPDDPLLVEDLAHAQFAARRYERALQTLRELKSMTGSARVDLMHLEARCLTMTDRTREARNLYLRLSQEAPANAEVWIELGQVAYSLGDYRRVALAGSRAVALAPDRFEGHLLIALHQQNHGDRNDALRHLKQAADLAPDNAWPHLLLGMMHEEDGRNTEALAAYAAALRAEPGNPQARQMFQIATEVGSHPR